MSASMCNVKLDFSQATKSGNNCAANLCLFCISWMLSKPAAFEWEACGVLIPSWMLWFDRKFCGFLDRDRFSQWGSPRVRETLFPWNFGGSCCSSLNLPISPILVSLSHAHAIVKFRWSDEIEGCLRRHKGPFHGRCGDSGVGNLMSRGSIHLLLLGIGFGAGRPWLLLLTFVYIFFTTLPFMFLHFLQIHLFNHWLPQADSSIYKSVWHLRTNVPYVF